MLRSLVLILLLVNAAFYAWSHGWLNQLVGVRPDAQHEPQRLQLQVEADKITVDAPPGAPAPAPSPQSTAPTSSAPEDGPGLPPAAPASAPDTAMAVAASGPQASGQCVEAGPFNDAEYNAAEAGVAKVLPAGSWISHTVAIQGLWLVYMGPYAEADVLDHKLAELRRIKGLSFEEVRTPAKLAQGISLGRFNKLSEAEAGLEALRSRGIRTARVVNVRPTMEVQVLKVPQATLDMQARLAGLKLPQGKGFSPCQP